MAIKSLDNQFVAGPEQQSWISWLALWRVNRVGPALFQRILDFFQDPSEVFYQPANELLKLGFSQLAVQEIAAFNQRSPQSEVYRGGPSGSELAFSSWTLFSPLL